MSKNIVVCADGTWNKPAAHTNVDRLFNALPGEPNTIHKTMEIGSYTYRLAEQQIAFYLEGVGARPSRSDLLAGATGTGLHAKVLDGYILISRVYEPGDKIFLFGFSRGAYTARSLGALIAAAGLLPKAKAENAACRDLANQIWWSFKHREAGLAPDAPDATDPCPIRLVGVWDTVGALGIPFFNGIHVMDELERHLFDFADLTLSLRVQYGLHAMAIDERRQDFVPTPWTARHGVTQLWFPGVHSDVGGGYASRGLADITLDWMLGEATKPEVGLQLKAMPTLAPNPLADRHESVDSVIWAIRSAPRQIPDDAVFHACVPERFTKRHDYRPQALRRHPLFRAFYVGDTPQESICTTEPGLPIRHLETGEALQTVVLSEKWWNAAGLKVEAHEVYDIVATGTWSDASKYCNADGWKGFPLATLFRRIRDKNWFHLCLATSTDAWLEFYNADFIKGLTGLVGRVDDASTLYPVGVQQRVTMSQAGFAYLFANDAPSCYGNNAGYLDVTITRVA